MNISYFKLIFVIAISLSSSLLTGQKNFYKLHSDSLLYHEKIDQALEKLRKENSTSIAIKKSYLETLIEYTNVFEDSLFTKIKRSIDSIVNHPDIEEVTKKVYLNHFLSSFSRRVFENNLRITYSDKGLSFDRDSTFQVHFLFHKGRALSDQGKHEEAIETLEKAEAICLNFNHPDENMLAKILYFLGASHKAWAGSELDIGYNYLQKAELTFLENTTPDTSYLAQVYGMLSDVAWDMRDSEKGLGYVKKYKQLHNSIGPGVFEDPTQKAQNQFHFYYKEMQFYNEGQKAEALNLVLEAEKDFPPYRNNKEIKLRMAAIYNFMGEMYIRDEPSRSIPYYKKAIKTYDNRNSSYHLQYLFNVGKASLYSGNARESLKYSDELIKLASPNNDPRMPFFYFLQAFAYIKLDDFDKALEITNKVLALMGAENTVNLETHEGIRTFESTIAISTNINLLSRMGLEFLNGFEGSDQSKNIANALFQIGILEYGKTFKSTKVTSYTKSMYEQLVGGILQTKDFLKSGDISVAELIEFSENTNEKYLWANHKSKNDETLFFDKELLEKETAARDELTNLKKQALVDSSETLQEAIFDVELNLERIEKLKRGSNSSYYLFEETSFSLDSLQEKLDGETMVLRYEYILDTLYLFTILRDSIDVIQIPKGLSVSELSEDAYKMLSDPNSNVDSLFDKLENLAALLLPEIKSNIKNLVIKGSRHINLIPFDVLRKQNKFLLEKYNISYIQALGLYLESDLPHTIEKALLIAPVYNDAVNNDELLALRGDEYNLAGALEEVNLISKVLPGKALQEEKALKSTFRKVAEKYDVLHFSMHSILNDKDPDLSNLAFYDGESDSKLFINELYSMRLRAHLAVLSACSTAIGKEKPGDGIISLSRAFTFAGVPSIVASLWDAPDGATKSIMINFYENLISGVSKSQALREAKNTYLTEQELIKFKHPFYWAGFVVQGDTSPIQIKERKNISGIITMLAGIALFVAGFFWAQKSNRLSKNT